MTDLGAFVGRAGELEEVAALLRTRRLVTLTGVGGAGKTRLATEVLMRADVVPEDGTWWVDLGALSEPGALVRSVARSLRLLIEPGDDALDDLVARLRPQARVICLDTCEHLLDAVADLTQHLVTECPGLVVLGTSRESLGVPGETVYRVPPLGAGDAAALFVERAGRRAPTLDLSGDARDIAEICDRVDRLPLGIELAAAWVDALSTRRVADGLAEGVRLLDHGPRAAVPRHRAITASMEWSHSLLNEAERTVLRRLAVFAGSFDLDAATAVCGVGDTTLGSLRRLVDKSLVVPLPEQGEGRFRLLDTVRQYAVGRLHTAGESGQTRAAHLDHYLGLAERVVPLLDEDQDRWRDVLDRDRANVNAALVWGLGTSAYAETARRLVALMVRSWLIHGQASEGLAMISRALAADPEARTPTQASLYAGRSVLAMIGGRLDLIASAAPLARVLAEETGEKVADARALLMSAYPVFFTDAAACAEMAAESATLGAAAGDAFTADWAPVLGAYCFVRRDLHREAMELARPALASSLARGDRFTASFALAVDCFRLANTGDVTGAVAVGHEVVELLEPMGDYFATGTNLTNVAYTVALSGDVEGGYRLMQPVVRAFDEVPGIDVVGHVYTMGHLCLWEGRLEEAVDWFELGLQQLDTFAWTAIRCLPAMAGALRRLGREEGAAAAAERAVDLGTVADSPLVVSAALDEQARLCAATDPAAAYDLHHQALSWRRQRGLRTFYADSLDALARLTASSGRSADAATLLGASHRARQEMGYPVPLVDRSGHRDLTGELQAGLGAGFQEAWDAGADRDLDEAVAWATRGRGSRDRPTAGWASLTPTELEVVGHLAAGLTNPDIGRKMLVSRSTVKAHLSHVYAKLGTSSRTELAAIAVTKLAEGD